MNLTRTQFGVYQSRFTLPVLIQTSYPGLQREYRRSLRTKDKSEAKHLHAILQVSFNTAIRFILKHTSGFTKKQVQTIINKALSNDMGNIKTGYTLDFHENGNIKTASTNDTQEDHENLMVALDKERAFRESASPAPVQNNLQASSYNTAPTIGSNKSKNLDKTFRQLADTYLDDNRNKWVIGTIQQREGELRKITLLLPDTQLRQYSERVTEELRDDLATLPVRCPIMSLESGEWRDTDKAPITSETQRKYFSLYCDVIEHGLIGSDVQAILGDISVESIGKDGGNKKFTDIDLKKIFNGCIYTDKCHQHVTRKDFMYWIPLVGLFTGMRLNEICQLHIEDIKQYKDFWYIDINLNFHNPNVPDKSLKNESAKRLVPIHDDLIKLGFIDFVKKQRSGVNSHMLFEQLKMSSRGKWYKEPSRYFGDYLKLIEVKTKKKVFHSLRHNFTTAMTIGSYEANVSESADKRKRIIGHSLPDEVTQIYTHLEEKAIPSLKAVINLIEYDINLEHLYPLK